MRRPGTRRAVADTDALIVYGLGSRAVISADA